jgi:hypothetical protein
MTDDELLKAKVIRSVKWKRSKAVRAETGSDGSKAKSLLDERAGGTPSGDGGGDAECAARAPSGTATSVRGAATKDIDPGTRRSASDGGDGSSSDESAATTC